MSIAQLFFTVSAFLTSVLQAHKRFLVPALAPIFYNLGTILGIFFLSPHFGIYSAAFGIIFGAFLHMIVQLPWTKAVGFIPHLTYSPSHAGVKDILKLMPPRTAALSLSQIERWVAINLTSVLSAGSLAIFNFARQLYVLPITLFGVSLGQASFPILSSHANSKDLPKFLQTLTDSILQIFFFALPAGVIILVLRIPLVRLVFGARAFPWQATLLTGKALALLTLSIAPQAVNHLLTRAFHAQKNTRTPLKISLFTIIFFILSANFTTRHLNWGVLGITFSLSLSNFLNFLILYILIHRTIGALPIITPIIKMILVSFLTGLSLWFPLRLLDQFVFDTTRTFPLILLTLIVSIIGFVVYLTFSWLLKINQLKEVIFLWRKLGNWRRLLTQTDEVIETSVADQI